MAVAAALKFVQGGNIGNPGQALFGVASTPVQTSNGNNATVTTWTFTVLDVPAGSAVPIGVAQTGATPTWTFTPDVAGGYLVQITVSDGTNTATDIRCFGIKAATGRFEPPFQGDNVSLNFGSNTRGWAAYQDQWNAQIDVLSTAPVISTSMTLSWLAGGGAGLATVSNTGAVGFMANSGLASLITLNGDVTGAAGSNTVTKWTGGTIGNIQALAGDFLSFGVNPATTGALRLANALAIKARNQANTADVALVQLTIGNVQTFGDSTQSLTTALTSNNQIILQIGSTNALGISTGQMINYDTLGNNTLQWNFAASTTTTAVLAGGTAFTWSQADNAGAGATAIATTFRAQNATGTGATTGGIFKLQSGSGATAGALQFFAGATQVGSLAGAVADFIALGGNQGGNFLPVAGLLRFSQAGANFQITYRNAANTGDNSALYAGADNLQIGHVGWTALLLGCTAAAITVRSNGSVLFQDSVPTTTLTATLASTGASGFTWVNTVTSVSYGHSNLTSAGTGASTVLTAQGCTAGVGNGGFVLIQGGIHNTTGLKGGVRLQLDGGNAQTMVEVTEVVSGQRLVAFCQIGALTTASCPSGAGDGVIFIANRVTASTVNAVGGGYLYAEAGALKWRGSTGTVTMIAAA